MLDYLVDAAWLKREDTIRGLDLVLLDVRWQSFGEGRNEGDHSVLVALAAADEKLAAGYVAGA